MKTENLIVGQGIAGTLVAYFLWRANHSFIIIDPGESVTSSRIAAGMFTPVSGKRMTKSPMAELLLPFAVKTYTELEELLGKELVHLQPIYSVFGSVKEQNDLMSRLESPDFASYVNVSPKNEPHIIDPFGAFEIMESGWLNTSSLFTEFRHFLKQEQRLIESSFEYQALVKQENSWSYKGMECERVIFCEGYKARSNPFLKNLDIVPCKGDVLKIRCANGPKERIVKKGCYMVNLQDDEYKVGSTYLWEETDPTPTPRGKADLTDKLDKLIDLPYEIVEHYAGIRPTTKNRKPVYGQSAEFSNLFFLNGLGTKGVMQGPWFAHKLVETIFSPASKSNDL